MRDLIARHVAALERERGVRVLLAVESGSRAWGCPSPDSDFDVRAVYAHPPLAYLSVVPPPEQLEYFAEGRELDVAGWELRKTLRLIGGGNATPGEWAQSPVVYHEAPGFRQNLLATARDFARPRKLLDHYRGVARGRIGEARAGDEVKLKRVCYALRAALAGRWIIAHARDAEGALPPMTFADLLPAAGDDTVGTRIEELLARKAAVDEAYVWRLDAPLDAWLRDTLAELDAAAPGLAALDPVGADRDALDATFRRWANLAA